MKNEMSQNQNNDAKFQLMIYNNKEIIIIIIFKYGRYLKIFSNNEAIAIVNELL